MLCLPTSPQPAPLRASELPGTYELVDRALVRGKVLRRPDIAALYTFGNGRANFNLFVRNADGRRSPPSHRSFGTPVSSHCTQIKKAGDRLIFAPPSESVIATCDRNGFTAVIRGKFTDHWRKIT